MLATLAVVLFVAAMVIIALVGLGWLDVKSDKDIH